MSIDWERVARVETHPVRLAILHRLAGSENPRSPKELSAVIDENLGDTAYHCRKLREAGLIHSAGSRPVRGATEHFYSLGGER